MITEPVQTNEGRDFWIRRFLSKIINKIKITNCIIAFLSAVTYMILSYDFVKIDIFDFIDIGICVIFLVEYSFELYITQHKLGFILNLNSLIEMLTIIPSVLLFVFWSNFFIYFLITISWFLRLNKCLFLNWYIKL